MHRAFAPALAAGHLHDLRREADLHRREALEGRRERRSRRKLR